jgi:hypothetical protein
VVGSLRGGILARYSCAFWLPASCKSLSNIPHARPHLFQQAYFAGIVALFHRGGNRRSNSDHRFRHSSIYTRPSVFEVSVHDIQTCGRFSKARHGQYARDRLATQLPFDVHKAGFESSHDICIVRLRLYSWLRRAPRCWEVCGLETIFAQSSTGVVFDPGNSQVTPVATGGYHRCTEPRQPPDENSARLFKLDVAASKKNPLRAENRMVSRSELRPPRCERRLCMVRHASAGERCLLTTLASLSPQLHIQLVARARDKPRAMVYVIPEVGISEITR